MLLFSPRAGACLGALLALALLVRPAAAVPPLFAKGDPARAKVRGGLPLLFSPRPAADGSRRRLPAAAEAPAVVWFVSPPTAADVAALRAAGARVPVRADGTPRGRGHFITARLSPEALRAVAALDRVAHIWPDGSPLGAPRPLDGTVAQVEAHDVWREADALGLPLDGAGITVCSLDQGIDIFHPMFFRADGGYVAWVDRDGDGQLTPGSDAVDLHGDGQLVTLRVLDGLITWSWSDDPLLGSDDPGYALGLDWLYADENDNEVRDFGRAAGFDDASPSLGEQLYVADDINGNGRVDAGEKLVGLGTSKVRAWRIDDHVFRRGVDLIDAPLDGGISHGCGSSGVMVGGQPGLSVKVGIAPGADLVMMTSRETYQQEVFFSDSCIEEGARVVLHEYAPWVGYFLDGSSPMEQLIDQTVPEGIAHINPAGNLSGAAKLYKHQHPAGTETVIELLAPPDYPGGDFQYLGISLLWRDTTRPQAVVLEDPTGHSMAMPPSPGGWIYEAWHDGSIIYATREISLRGTCRLDMWILPQDEEPAPIAPGTWLIRMTDPAPPGSPDLEVIAYVMDELSRWSRGIYFPAHSSEDHLIGYPGTSDSAIAIAAYTGHGYWGGRPGVRASYSGRGHRIDGQAILDIAAPDDPISAGYREGSPARYFIYGGTSGASPHVAGAAALLLQAHPELNGANVRQALHDGALVDEPVGEVPNDDYGYGKLRIYRSLYGSDPPAGRAPMLGPVEATVIRGRTERVAVEVFDHEEPSSALVLDLDRDYDGSYEERLADPSLSVRYDELGTFRLKLRATDSTGRTAATLATIEVVEPLAELAPAGGLACASRPAAGGSPGRPWLAALGLVLAARGRRRRRG